MVGDGWPFQADRLTLCRRNRDSADAAAPRPSYDTESDIHAKVALTYALPDGSTFSKTVTAGDTVAQIKKALADARGIPYSTITLSLDGKVAVPVSPCGGFAVAVDDCVSCRR